LNVGLKALLDGQIDVALRESRNALSREFRNGSRTPVVSSRK
jgi:hypothetical protein